MSVVELSGQAPAGIAGGPTVPPNARRRLLFRLLGSELRLIVGRRRNQAGITVLAVVPIIMAIAIKLSDPGVGHGPDLLSQVTANGLLVPLAALGVEITMFLPLAIAMLSGDAIAGEANVGTLRYLLTVPVSRTRLLAVKYLSLVIGAALGVLAVAIPGAIVGLALFGAGPMITLSGTQLGMAAAVWRLVLVCGYLVAALSALAAIGLFISVLTEQPIAAAIAVMIVTIMMWILVAVPQVSWLHPWLLVNHWMAYMDLLRDPIAWERVLVGLLVDLGYTGVFLTAAWARFAGKDVTS